MAQRIIVFLLIGGVAGFGAVFLQVPGIVLALIGAAILAGTTHRAIDLHRLGAYLIGVGIVGFSLVGPSIRGSGGFLFASPWLLVAGYATVALAGSALVAGVAIGGILRRNRVP